MKYVMSDIHGNYDAYVAMKEKINLCDSDKLIIIGDVIDRGKDGIKILQDIMASKNVFMMLGNHELMMFESDMLDQGINNDKNDLERVRKNWIETNGGYYTMKAFCDLNDGEQLTIIDFIKSLINTPPLRLARCDNSKVYALCHGWPSDPSNVGDSDAYDYVRNSVWDRPCHRSQMPDENVKNVLNEKGVDRLIIGHTPVFNLYTRNEMKECNNSHYRILHTPGYINIDCGSGHSRIGSCLGCLCLDTMEEFYV